MLEDLKKQVCQANLDLVAAGLVIQTWGNVSGVDRSSGRMVIKPSGVPYDQMEWDQMVVVDLETGQAADSEWAPSSDTPTHLELYRSFENIGGVVHTHSMYATAWAQAVRRIPPMGTTHADYFNGPVLCTRPLGEEEIKTAYEANTAKAIVEAFADYDYMQIPAVLVAVHGPFTWGPDPDKAVHNAIILEHLARLASETIRIAGYPRRFSPALLDKHYTRKHGPDAYYGQGK